MSTEKSSRLVASSDKPLVPGNYADTNACINNFCIKINQLVLWIFFFYKSAFTTTCTTLKVTHPGVYGLDSGRIPLSCLPALTPFTRASHLGLDFIIPYTVYRIESNPDLAKTPYYMRPADNTWHT